MADFADPKNVTSLVRNFFAAYPERTYSEGQILALPGEAPPGIFYIVDGAIIMYDVTETGEKAILNVFKPGAFMPMSWAITPERTPGTNQFFIEASSPLTVRLAPVEEVLKFLRTNPEIVWDLLARVYRGSDGLLKRMALLMGGSARRRVAGELVNAARRFGDTGQNGLVTVTLNEQDIAERSGLTRETVNREFRKLKDEGLLVTHRGSIDIPDIDALVVIAN